MGATGKRTVLVLEEQAAESARWIADLETQFEVKRVVSVIGTHRTLQDGPLAAAVLNINFPETRSATLIRLLRGQPGLETVPLFLLVPNPIDGTKKTVEGLSGVEVLEVGRAHLTLRAAILSFLSAPRRDEKKRAEVRMRTAPKPEPAPSRDVAHSKLHKRFLTQSAQRGERALHLCDALRAPGLSPARRRVMLNEMRDLFNLMKGEATLLRLRALAEVLGSAEGIVDRIDIQRSVIVPRGVLGLLSDLAGLGTEDASISTLDVELHRTRLTAAEESLAAVPGTRRN